MSSFELRCKPVRITPVTGSISFVVKMRYKGIWVFRMWRTNFTFLINLRTRKKVSLIPTVIVTDLLCAIGRVVLIDLWSVTTITCYQVWRCWWEMETLSIITKIQCCRSFSSHCFCLRLLILNILFSRRESLASFSCRKLAAPPHHLCGWLARKYLKLSKCTQKL